MKATCPSCSTSYKVGDEKIPDMGAQIKCPKCECNLAFWWLRQLRAADESEVRFFRCTACNHTWRQYD